MAVVLVVEDDAAVREGLELALRRQQHTVRTAASGEDGMALLREQAPEIVVLDLMLPGMDGFETCRRMRALGQVPIIMLTARSDDFDVVAGLEAGADDYVVKPVEPRVLDARIRAVLRRAAGDRDARPGSTERHGDLEIDRAGMRVCKHGEPVALTPTELKLLLVLSGSPGQVHSRRQLLTAVWGHDYLGDSRLVDACVQRLRAKIEDVPARPGHVQTVRGFGYRFGRS
ncbi:response regulator transcription factor [Amycolatopsis jiangsuensis]|uniref:DNA-binding response OmpR family regulator n=1 Tax=Amycolatopsis jiangsuensis TaxID=1181879 RepID=A0A840IKL4_9PSEU|nr:response regulator transcription factor [Amycolatopsis jiangsuensis]MBB4682846.1 DNA-binding response OmpR family regulator [Amycolatopsis jiangsuensis]